MIRSILIGVAALVAWVTPAAAQGGGVPGAPTAPHVRGIRTVSITVSSIDATIAFYRQAVPYRLVRRYTMPRRAFDPALVGDRAGPVEIALIELPTMFVQLMDFEPGRVTHGPPRPVIGPGYTHICFQSPATDPAYAKFLAAGLTPISRGGPGGVDLGGYGVRYAYGRDPDGIMIENEILDRPRRGEPAWVTHVAAAVHDRDATVDFYTRVLGFAPHRLVEQEKRPGLDAIADIDDIAIRGAWFAVGNMEIELWQFVRPQTPRPAAPRRLDEIGYGAIGFEVDDLASTTRRLRALGVDLVGRPLDVGGWRTQYGRDPEGNLIAFQQRARAPIGESIVPKLRAPAPR